MTNILPPRLSWDHIRDEAEKFRQEYVRPPEKIPVPIIEIAEIDLNIRINPQPGLRHRSDIEAFLESDLRTLCIDQDLYEDPRQEKRLRFTFAHEIGHLILHRTEISQIQFAGIEEWVDFRIKMKEEDNRWFESQAYEFAGRLLVPRNQLIDKIKDQSDGIQEYRDIADNEEALKDAISKLICDDFFVSAAVMYRRINAEKIWVELSL